MCRRNSRFPYLHIMKKSNGIVLILVFCGLFAGMNPAMAQQSRKDLEAQRKSLESQIKSTTEILKRTQKDKTQSLKQLKTLQAQIRQRQELLGAIEAELREVDREAALQERQRQEAEAGIRHWDGRLRHALRTAYVRSQLHPDWIYVLSAESLGAVLARWVYLRQYRNFARRQWEALTRAKERHQTLLAELESTRRAKAELFQAEQRNRDVIVGEQKNKESLLQVLGREEKKLKTQLAASEARKKKLDEEIARLIREAS